MISEQLRHPLSLFDNKGKVAIVTGASGAFGRGCAIALGALGGKLVLASGSRRGRARCRAFRSAGSARSRT
jgi:NAD(P)-dependent dehydrogenase (short-subunit alcohol dehydrogenase family)